MITLQFVDVEVARQFVPSHVRIVSLLPGKTVGGIFYAHYQAGSTLEYHELIVVPALAWIGGKLGSWIPRIYVDNPASMAGGIEMWGMPKQLATFDTTEENGRRCVRIHQGEDEICRLAFTHPRVTFEAPVLSPPVFGVREGRILVRMKEKARGRLGLIKAEVSFSESSPYHVLGLNRPLMAYEVGDLQLTFPDPQILGEVP